MHYLKIDPPEKVKFRESMILEKDSLDILRLMPSNSVQCAVTSPPYWGLCVVVNTIDSCHRLQ
jgi:site-specific DNA-methyltransferase (adenine-specific)